MTGPKWAYKLLHSRDESPRWVRWVWTVGVFGGGALLCYLSLRAMG